MSKILSFQHVSNLKKTLRRYFTFYFLHSQSEIWIIPIASVQQLHVASGCPTITARIAGKDVSYVIEEASGKQWGRKIDIQ